MTRTKIFTATDTESRVWSIIIFVLSLIFNLSLLMENNESFDLTLIDDA